MGDFIIQMRDDKPITTTNFVNLVKQGLYDGTVFHRIIDGFMIQGGQNNSVNVPTIADEIGSGNRNIAGSIAMAKTDQPNSATSQFFINVADNGNNVIDQQGTRFDSVYTQFGQVISGMDVVLSISRVSVTANPFGEQSQPITPVTLISAEILS
jgi:cyclophilin family peptidyl-prolyl cis-trans isomerase